MSKKANIETIKEAFETEGYILLTTEYIDNKQKLHYICSKGHTHKVSWADWNSKNVRCPYCNGRPIITIDIVRESMAKEGYTLLTDSYINNKSDLEFKCPNGHIHKTTWSKWNSHNYRCPYCYGNAKKKIDDLSVKFEEEGYKLLSDYYGNCNTKLKLLCPNNHVYEVSWDNWNHSGSRCPRCGLVGVSEEEIDIYKFIISEYQGEVSLRNYTIIKPKELDIVLEKDKIAIEYCGLYWHSELMGKNMLYHLSKRNDCEKNGYRLLTIFGDEYKHKKDILFSRLKNILGKTENIIYARKTKVKEISSSTARGFCEKNHIQGYTGSSIKLGLFLSDELVSVMTFSKPSVAKGHKNIKKGIWELSRFCSKLNTNVLGGASKLLMFFKRSYEWQEILSYADKRWSFGNLYNKLGFSLVGETKPNYWYIKGSCSTRIHRFALRKKPDEPKDVTEWELRKVQGYNRIWDCGNLKYVMYNN